MELELVEVAGDTKAVGAIVVAGSGTFVDWGLELVVSLLELALKIEGQIPADRGALDNRMVLVVVVV